LEYMGRCAVRQQQDRHKTSRFRQFVSVRQGFGGYAAATAQRSQPAITEPARSPV
jgi:hypothetical protein